MEKVIKEMQFRLKIRFKIKITLIQVKKINI